MMSPTKMSKKDAANQSARICWLVTLLWLATVLTLARFCAIELRVLKAEKELSRGGGSTVVKQQQRGSNDSLASTDDDDGSDAPTKIDSTRSASDGMVQPSKTTTDALTVVVDDDARRARDGTSLVHDEHNNDGDAAKKKGRLILHVGPSKTATTTLQTDLTGAHDKGWLIDDNVFYAGRYYRPYSHPVKGFLMLNRSESALVAAALIMLNPCSDTENKTSCCVAFAGELDALYQRALELHQNNTTGMRSDDLYLTIVLSDEAFGNMWLDSSDYQAISNVVAQEWDVTVVAGYRRFYEWILSSKYQRDRTDRKHGKDMWPATADGDSSKGGGRALLPMFPNTFATWRQYYHYTDSVLHSVNGTFAVRLLNLHAAESAGSVLTQFLCDIMVDGTAAIISSHACALSRQRDALAAELTIMNSQEQTTISSLYYDAVATAAALSGWVNVDNHKRGDVRDAVRVYHEETLGLAPDELILQCPTAEQLEDLYEVSVSMERMYMPEALDEDAHREGFVAKVAALAFCWVNATAVLEQPHWQEFFLQFASDTLIVEPSA